MEINAANVARHKIFCRKTSFVQKKWEKKIQQLSTEEIHEITDNAVPVTTKKP